MNLEPTTHHIDEAEIRTLLEELLADWGRGDGRAYGSRFTEDADYVAFDGTRTRGSGEIYRSHQELFDKWLKGTRLVGGDPEIKFLTPEVALVHATGNTIMRGKSKSSPERDSIQTLVAVKHGNEWRFAAFHNSRVRPIGSLRGALLWAFTDKLWRIFALGRKGV